MARDFTRVGVVGLGTMGAGIVEVFARNGVDVVAVDIDEAGLDHGKQVLIGSTGRALSRGKLTQAERDALHARVTFTIDLGDLADCQLVVEAVPEQPGAQGGDLRPAGPDRLARTRSSPRTRRRCRSPRSPSPPAARSRSSACTSSTPRRS